MLTVFSLALLLVELTVDCFNCMKISSHIRRIENVEKNLKALSETASTKEDGKKAKAEMKKLYVSDAFRPVVPCAKTYMISVGWSKRR